MKLPAGQFNLLVVIYEGQRLFITRQSAVFTENDILLYIANFERMRKVHKHNSQKRLAFGAFMSDQGFTVLTPLELLVLS